MDIPNKVSENYKPDDTNTPNIFTTMKSVSKFKFMYDLFSYQNPEDKDKDNSHKKKMEDFEDFLLLYDYNGVNILKNNNYKNMYDKILEQFDLNNKEQFIKKLEINNIQNLFDGQANQKIIDPLYSILEKYKILYNEKPKKKEINIKYKQLEVKRCKYFLIENYLIRLYVYNVEFLT